MEIININSNSNNDSIICLTKTGKLISIEYEINKTFSNINFNVFINNTLDKIVICIAQFIMI